MTKLAFIDTETTGLDAERHQIWEVGLIIREGGDNQDVVEKQYLWQLEVDLSVADPFALNVGKFWERRWPEVEWPDKSRRYALSMEGTPDLTENLVISEMDFDDWAKQFMNLTAGAHLVGAVVSFDEERLRRLLRANGAIERWHYHLVDIEALMVGFLAGDRQATVGDDVRPSLPWKSKDLSRAVGVDPDKFEAHTALGDAEWAMACYDAVMGP